MESVSLANGATIVIRRGDITTAETDAIVNAANAYLAAGGGVSGAIHRAAGAELTEECADLALRHGTLEAGESVITGGYNLRAGHVIHSLGPTWHGGDSGEAAALARTYRGAIELADQHRLASIAFPSISSGIFGYPVEEAAMVAVDTVATSASAASTVRRIEFVLFDDETYAAFRSALARFF